MSMFGTLHEEKAGLWFRFGFELSAVTKRWNADVVGVKLNVGAGKTSVFMWTPYSGIFPHGFLISLIADQV